QRVRKAIIDIARERQHHGIAEQARNPPLAWSRAPDGDRDIGADDEAALRVGRVQATTHVIERGAVCGERSRLNVDILEGDVACSNCCEQLVALPVDAAVTDGAARVVPDGEMRRGCHGPAMRRGYYGSRPSEPTILITVSAFV